jgi:hypothetical protein
VVAEVHKLFPGKPIRYLVALFRNLKRLKLDVAQHVPIHSNPGPNADFERIVGPVAARAPATGGGG